MKRLNVLEMKKIRGGECGSRCYCVMAFMDAGWDFDKAYKYCKEVLELPRQD